MSISFASGQRRWPSFFMAAALAAVVVADDVRGQAGTATFTVLPHFDPSAANRSDAAYEVTNQGVVVGFGNASDGTFRAAIWGPAGAVGGLGPDPDFPNTVAYSVSGNAQVICGTALSEFSTDLGAFVWTSSQGIRRLPTLWTSPSEARVVSDDGTTIWGYATNESGAPQIVRWNANTLAVTAIPPLSGSFPSQTGIYDTSSNGQIAVGYEVAAPFTYRSRPDGPAWSRPEPIRTVP